VSIYSPSAIVINGTWAVSCASQPTMSHDNCVVAPFWYSTPFGQFFLFQGSHTHVRVTWWCTHNTKSFLFITV